MQKSNAIKPAPKAPPVTHKEIRAESFVLVGSDGQPRAELRTINDDAVLALLDAQGRLRLTLRGGAREATINVFGEDNEQAAAEMITVGWNCNIQKPFIRLRDRADSERVIALEPTAAEREKDEDERASSAPPAPAYRPGADPFDDFCRQAERVGTAIGDLLSDPHCPASLAQAFADLYADLSNEYGDTSMSFHAVFDRLAAEAAARGDAS